MDRRRAAAALLALAACIATSDAAPTASNHTALDLYDEVSEGCYYNFQHYGEGDRIMTNEPCLNCTCHNRMLMCYLRVCPFTKAIGQDCTVEKRADQCCPIVTCPDVPVDLLTSTSTSSPAEYGGTGLGKVDKYGCSINGKYFPEGAKVPPMPNKPCEHCYCIRNMTTCVMQECTLHVDGCTPIYHKDVCCPVRYFCDHPEDEIPLLDDMTTTVRPTPGFLLTTTAPTEAPEITTMPARRDCMEDDQLYPDGSLIKTDKPCEHCYCMKGDIVCVVQECGTPMENEGKNCTSLPPREGQCCPDTYICEGDEVGTEPTTEMPFGELATTTEPPRRVSVEGSGYRNEPDEITYTEVPTFATELEGSGEEELVDKPIKEAGDRIVPSDEIEYIPKTTPSAVLKEIEKATTEPDKGLNTVPSGILDGESTEPSMLEKITPREEQPITEQTRRQDYASTSSVITKEEESFKPEKDEQATPQYEMKPTEPTIIEKESTPSSGIIEPSVEEITSEGEIKATEPSISEHVSFEPEEEVVTEIQKATVLPSVTEDEQFVSEAEQEATTLASDEAKTTPSPLATKVTEEEQSVSEAEQEATTLASDEAKTTPSPFATEVSKEEHSVSEAEQEATTLASDEAKTTPSPLATKVTEEEQSVSEAEQEATTLASDEAKTTPSPFATEVSKEEHSVSEAEQEATTLASDKAKTTPSPLATKVTEEEQSVSEAEHEATTLASDEAKITPSPLATEVSKEEHSVSEAEQEATTLASDEAKTTPSPLATKVTEEEQSVSEAEQEATTLASDEAKTTPSPFATEVSKEEHSVSEAEQEATTFSSDEAKTTPSPLATKLTEEEQSVSETEQEATTLASDEAKTTPSPLATEKQGDIPEIFDSRRTSPSADSNTTPKSIQEEDKTELPEYVTTPKALEEQKPELLELITTPKALLEEQTESSEQITTPKDVQEEEKTKLPEYVTTPKDIQEEQKTQLPQLLTTDKDIQGAEVTESSELITTPKTIQEEEKMESPVTSSKAIPEEEQTAAPAFDQTTPQEKLGATVPDSISEQNTVPVSFEEEQSSETSLLDKSTEKDESKVTEIPKLEEQEKSTAIPSLEESSEPSLMEKTTPRSDIEVTQVYHPAEEGHRDTLTTVPTEGEYEFTTEPEIKKQYATTLPESDITKEIVKPEDKISSTKEPSTVKPEEYDSKHTTTQSSEQQNVDETTQEKEATTETIMELSTFAHVSDKEPATTLMPVSETVPPVTDKTELLETTTINLAENEIAEVPSPGRIPGEGDCLLEGITYKNDSVVPSTNKCHTGCKCVSSIIKCDPIICSSPPENMDNCQPRYDTPDSCCPTYVCDHGMITIPPQPQSHITGVEITTSAPSIECSGAQCEATEDKQSPTESPAIPDRAGVPAGDCGSEGCITDSQLPTEQCTDSKCELPQSSIKEQAPEIPSQGVIPSCDKSGDCALGASVPCEGTSCGTGAQLCNKQGGCDIEPEIPPPIYVPQLCQNEEECKQVKIPKPAQASCVGESCTTVKEDCSTGECKDIIPQAEDEICSDENGCKKPEQAIDCENGKCAEKDSQDRVQIECSGDECMQQQPASATQETTPSGQLSTEPSLVKESTSSQPEITKDGETSTIPTEIRTTVSEETVTHMPIATDVPEKEISRPEPSFDEEKIIQPEGVTVYTPTVTSEPIIHESTETEQKIPEITPEDGIGPEAPATEKESEMESPEKEKPEISSIPKESEPLEKDNETESQVTATAKPDKTSDEEKDVSTEIPLEQGVVENVTKAPVTLEKDEQDIKSTVLSESPVTESDIASTKIETEIDQTYEASPIPEIVTTKTPLEEIEKEAEETPMSESVTSKTPEEATKLPELFKTTTESAAVTEHTVPITSEQTPTKQEEVLQTKEMDLITSRPETAETTSPTQKTETGVTFTDDRTGEEEKIPEESTYKPETHVLAEEVAKPEAYTPQDMATELPTTVSLEFEQTDAPVSEQGATIEKQSEEELEKQPVTEKQEPETVAPGPESGELEKLPVTDKQEPEKLAPGPESDEVLTKQPVTEKQEPENRTPALESEEELEKQPVTEKQEPENLTPGLESEEELEKQPVTEKPTPSQESEEKLEKQPVTEKQELEEQTSGPVSEEELEKLPVTEKQEPEELAPGTESIEPYSTEKQRESTTAPEASEKTESPVAEEKKTESSQLYTSTLAPVPPITTAPDALVTEKYEISTKESEKPEVERQTVIPEIAPTIQQDLETKAPEKQIPEKTLVDKTGQEQTTEKPLSEEKVTEISEKEHERPEILMPVTDSQEVPEQEFTETPGEFIEQEIVTKSPDFLEGTEEQLSTHEPQKSSTQSPVIEEFDTKTPELEPTDDHEIKKEEIPTSAPQMPHESIQTEIPIAQETFMTEQPESFTAKPGEDEASPTETQETEKEQTQTEIPLSLDTEKEQPTSERQEASVTEPEQAVTDSQGLGDKDYQPTDIVHTESSVIPVEVSTTAYEEDKEKMTKKPVQTAGPEIEHSETTPYLVELEEHTHKIYEAESTDIPLEESTTSRIEAHATEQESHVTTEKIPSDERRTELPEIETERPEHKVEVPVSSDDTKTTLASEELEKSTESALLPIDRFRPDSGQEDDKDASVTTPKQVIAEEESFTSMSSVNTGKPAKEETTTTIPSNETEKTSPVEEEPVPSISPDEAEKPTPVQEEHMPSILTETEKPSSAEEFTEQPEKEVTVKPLHVPVETTGPEEEFIPVTTKATTARIEEEEPTQPPLYDKTKPEEKPSEIPPTTPATEISKPDELQPTDEMPSPDEESHFPPSGGYNQEPDYVEEDQAFGPGTCRYGGKVYVSAQQIPRDDPCDFCFCFRSDIICLQQSCPPPIHGCHEEPIQGFCCPRYECPVSMATTLNVTTTTTTTTTTLPPHFLPHAYKGAAQRRGCQIKGHTYQVGEVVRASSGPCLHCTCGGDGQMKCDPKACTPEPMLRQMIAAAVSAKRRR